jgi:hypothetical protein
MAVYIVVGKLGNGKTLVSVGRIRDKLRAGCIVATNLDLNLEAMFGAMRRNVRLIRIPDKPTRDDLDAIGRGNEVVDEPRNGLLVLDECGTWFNSRSWQDKSRAGVNDWFLHARKLGFDVILIVQDESMIDSQARDAIGEHCVRCRRLDNIRVPLIGALIQTFTGIRLTLPRLHIASVRYGLEKDALVVDRWVYRGNDLFAAYDTRQAFLASYPHGSHSVLTPWHLVGRYRVPRNWGFYMRMTRIMWRRFKAPFAFGWGVALGVLLLAALGMVEVYRNAHMLQEQDFARVVREAAAELMLQSQTGASAPRPSELADLWIVGSAQVGARWYYDLARHAPGGVVTGTSSTHQLQLLGYSVQPDGPCRATLTGNGESRELRCPAVESRMVDAKASPLPEIAPGGEQSKAAPRKADVARDRAAHQKKS